MTNFHLSIKKKIHCSNDIFLLLNLTVSMVNLETMNRHSTNQKTKRIGTGKIERGRETVKEIETVTEIETVAGTETGK